MGSGSCAAGRDGARRVRGRARIGTGRHRRGRVLPRSPGARRHRDAGGRRGPRGSLDARRAGRADASRALGGRGYSHTRADGSSGTRTVRSSDAAAPHRGVASVGGAAGAADHGASRCHAETPVATGSAATSSRPAAGCRTTGGARGSPVRPAAPTVRGAAVVFAGHADWRSPATAVTPGASADSRCAGRAAWRPAAPGWHVVAVPSARTTGRRRPPGRRAA